MTDLEKEEIVQRVLDELRRPVRMECQMIDGATVPFYAHVGDAGMDLRANADVDIAPGETKIIPTGFKAAIPSGYEVAIRPRSGLNAKTPLRVAYGTIDEGYRGEWGVVLTNYSDPSTVDSLWTIDDKGKQGTFHIRKGDRVAQIVMSRYATMDLVEIEDIDAVDGNRGGGFGSSGTK